ncbi:MAG: cohesin domain-containing protein [Patescibacteria group bacterium]
MRIASINQLSRLFFVMAIFCGALIFTNTVSAASLYFSPSAKTYHVGNSFQVSAYVSTADAMNACEAIIDYPSNLLEATSVSTKSSIFSLMVENASFSSTNGTARFSGVVLNPGYTGTGGRLITINFRAKAVGEAVLTFTSAQVLANDGAGTDILSSRGSAKITILEKIEEPIIEKPTVPVTPTEPVSGSTDSQPSGTTAGGSASPTVTTTPAPIMATTVTNIIVPHTCAVSQLPTFFIKIGNVTFDQSSACLALIVVTIMTSATVSVWGFAHILMAGRRAKTVVKGLRTIKKINKLRK